MSRMPVNPLFFNKYNQVNTVESFLVPKDFAVSEVIILKRYSLPQERGSWKLEAVRQMCADPGAAQGNRHFY